MKNNLTVCQEKGTSVIVGFHIEIRFVNHMHPRIKKHNCKLLTVRMTRYR